MVGIDEVDMVASDRWPGGYVVTYDCESDCGFSDVPAHIRDEYITKRMQFTCICASVIPTSVVVRNASPDEVLAQATKMTWWRDVAEEGCSPIKSLLDLFDGADVIVGYNCLAFDFPLIKRFYKPVGGLTATQRYMEHRSKTLDIMARVRDVSGVYYKLDELLAYNDLPVKCGNGQTAVELWVAMNRPSLEMYCALDVELTARLSLLENLNIFRPTLLTLPQHVHGLRSAIAARRASGAQKRLRDKEDDEESFVLV